MSDETREGLSPKPTAGLYIHIPYCRTKCPYCDFYSVTSLSTLPYFLRALSVEMRLRAYELTGMEVATVYFGGGTPSLLSAADIERLLDEVRRHFVLAPSPEITLECNPGDRAVMEPERLIRAGVRRFSIGAQTFDPALLRFLGRRHTAEETIDLVERLREQGVRDLSLDLIYGIPGSTEATLEHDLDTLLRLRPTHISAYHLIYEEGTPLYRLRERGAVRELPEEESLRQSHRVRERLRDAGYEQYEISAFAIPGYRSRHNSSYWHGIPYLGLGPGAHSYIDPWRSSNPPRLRSYLRSLLRERPFLLRRFERLTPEMEYEEYLLTRLRTCEGLSLSEMEERFGVAVTGGVLRRAESHLDGGRLTREGDRLHLTERGIDLADRILLNLV